ncbi:MAG: winged helix-turn-helix transcriptional regulator [Candidatus Hodarchaeota archaeon]
MRLPEVWGWNIFEDNQEANRQLLKVKTHLEDRYPRLRLGPGKFLRKAINSGTQHAWVHHHLALKAKKQNITIKGRNWEADSSKKMPELDATDWVYTSQHFQNEVEDFDYRAESGVYFRDIHTNQIKTIKSLKKASENLTEVSETQTRIAGGIMTNFQITEAALQNSFQAQQEIQALKDQLQKPSEKLPEKKSLSPQQALLLDIIRTDPGQTRLELAKKYNLKRGSVNGQVKRLKALFMLFEKEGRLYSIEKLQRGDMKK